MIGGTPPSRLRRLAAVEGREDWRAAADFFEEYVDVLAAGGEMDYGELVRQALAAAAVVLIAVGGVAYFGRSRVIGLSGDTQTNATTQTLLIDYRGEGTTRSEAGDPARKSVTVPRASFEATILLPIGSEPGQYQLRLLDGDKRSKLAKEASGDLKDLAVRVNVNLDLRSFPSGAYTLEIRRQGEDWDPHPLIIR